MSKISQTVLIAGVVVVLSATAGWLFGGGESKPTPRSMPPPRAQTALPMPVTATSLTAQKPPEPPPPDGTDAGLAWLAKTQHRDGHWDLSPRRTGLALLAFLSAGQSHKNGPHKRTVRIGLKFLKLIQHPDGFFAVPDHARSNQAHAIATLAMVEAYVITRSPLFKQSAQQAIYALQAIEDPDDLTAGWACLTLAEAATNNRRVDLAAARKMARRYQPGVRGYTPAGHAMGLLGMDLLLEADETEANLLVGEPQFQNAAGRSSDPVYLYIGCWLAPKFGVRFDLSWRRDLVTLAASLQDTDGSFAPAGPQASRLGRVGATALMTAALAMTKWNLSDTIRRESAPVGTIR